MGRISTAMTGAYWALGTGDTTTGGGQSVTESYGYTAGGLPTYKDSDLTWPVILNPPYFATTGAAVGFSWNNEGQMTTYGGSEGFTYTLDAMNRPTALTQSGTGTVWVQNASYGPGGELRSMQVRTSGGAYYSEGYTYNNRSQTTEVQATGSGLPGMDLKYTYAAGTNNGQISQMNDALTGEQVSYTYDSLKRLITASTTQNHSQYPNAPWWGQSFAYDGFGNLVSKTPYGPGGTTNMSLSVNPATNQVWMTSGFSYDANGNITSIPATPQNVVLAYDEENRTGGSWYDLQNQPLNRGGQWNAYGCTENGWRRIR